jgi:hypothetical protein
MVSYEPAMQEGKKGKEKKRKYIPSCGHDLELEGSDGADDVVVVVKAATSPQRLSARQSESLPRTCKT